MSRKADGDAAAQANKIMSLKVKTAAKASG